MAMLASSSLDDDMGKQTFPVDLVSALGFWESALTNATSGLQLVNAVQVGNNALLCEVIADKYQAIQARAEQVQPAVCSL